MNVDMVELRVALMGDFAILVLKCPLPWTSQSMHHSAPYGMADEMGGGRDFLASLYYRAKRRLFFSLLVS
jgi:hypothetical protein